MMSCGKLRTRLTSEHQPDSNPSRDSVLLCTYVGASTWMTRLAIMSRVFAA
jgi:hypothetical protein